MATPTYIVDGNASCPECGGSWREFCEVTDPIADESEQERVAAAASGRMPRSIPGPRTITATCLFGHKFTSQNISYEMPVEQPVIQRQLSIAVEALQQMNNYGVSFSQRAFLAEQALAKIEALEPKDA